MPSRYRKCQKKQKDSIRNNSLKVISTEVILSVDKNKSEADQNKIIKIISIIKKTLISKMREMNIEERKKKLFLDNWTQFAGHFYATKFSLIPAIVLI